MVLSACFESVARQTQTFDMVSASCEGDSWPGYQLQGVCSVIRGERGDGY